jgi:hypothetical protein
MNGRRLRLAGRTERHQEQRCGRGKRTCCRKLHKGLLQVWMACVRSLLLTENLVSANAYRATVPSSLVFVMAIRSFDDVARRRTGFHVAQSRPCW